MDNNLSQQARFELLKVHAAIVAGFLLAAFAAAQVVAYVA